MTKPIFPFIMYGCQERRVWVFEDDPIPTTVKRQRAVKKVMYVVFFKSTGLMKVIKLEGQKIVTAARYTECCLAEVPQYLRIRQCVFA